MPDPTGYPRHELVQSDTLTELLEIRDSVTAGRHPKWQRVEPGTVILAGQPHRAEFAEPIMDMTLVKSMTARESVRNRSFTVPEVAASQGVEREWFVDSSWKPPLVLPAEPTWGIAVTKRFGPGLFVGQWSVDAALRQKLVNTDKGNFLWLIEVIGFIPLTDEQIARIEAAR